MLQPRIWIVPNFFQGVCELVHTGAVNLKVFASRSSNPVRMGEPARQ